MPEVIVARKMRGATNRAMYAMRGYGLSLDPDYLSSAKSELLNLREALGSAEELNKTAKSLRMLGGQLEISNASLSKYESLVAQTEEMANDLSRLRSELDDAASVFMKQTREFLLGQQRKSKIDLNERLRKLASADALQDITSKARILNFKGQADSEFEFIEQAIANLDGIPTEQKRIAEIVRRKEDKQLLQKLVSNAADYQHQMRDYVAQLKAGSAGSQMAAEIREKMDIAARAYVTAVEEFAKGRRRFG